MLMGDLIDRMAKKSPVGIMARAALEYALEPDGIDALFAKSAERQYC